MFLGTTSDKLTALARLINPSSLTEWQRLLLGGLAASLLLHLLALDLWRGQLGTAGRANGGVPAQLNLSLRSVAPVPLSPPLPVLAPVVLADPGAALQTRQVAVARSDTAATGGIGLVSAVSPDVPQMPLLAPATEPAMRPLSLAEGQVLYRLALLAVHEDVWPGVPAGGVVLELGLTADGHAQSVRLLRPSGNVQLDQAWLEWLQRAARRTELPPVLQGRAFALELEIQP